MNSLGFIRLIYEIYFKDKPDIDYIQKQGLLAIKIGQIHALRIDLLKESACIELSKLYQQTKAIPAEKIDKLISTYEKDNFLENFKEFNRTPFASASVGQVHLGMLKNKKRVAIKIIKKDFTRNFIKDVNIITKLISKILFIYPKLSKVADPKGIIQHIKEYTLDELDLRNEIKGQEELKNIYNKNKSTYDLSNLGFIEYHKELSGRDILVSDFIESYTFNDLLTRKEMKYNTLLQLFKIHGFFLFGAGTFHGDIHPGNIFLKKDKIIFIDNASLGHASKRLKKGLFYFFKALSEYNYKECAFFLNNMAIVSIDGKEYTNFEKKFRLLYKDFKNTKVSEVSLTKKMMETIKLGVNSGMSFEKGMFPIIKSLMFLDGMVLKCNPDAILLKDMRQFMPILEQKIKDF
jgi:ubiquinone biosynthesis protein